MYWAIMVSVFFFLWLCNSYIWGRTWAEGVREQGAEEDIWAWAGRQEEEDGDNYIMGFTIYICPQILLV
jgi:hypothetical protein